MVILRVSRKWIQIGISIRILDDTPQVDGEHKSYGVYFSAVSRKINAARVWW